MKRHKPRPRRFGPTQAEEIRAEKRSGASYGQLAKKYQASKQTVHAVVTRRGPYK